MMQIQLLTIGKLKEKYWKDAVAEYQKRLSRFTKLDIIEIKEQYIPENPSEQQIQQALLKEAKHLENFFKQDDCIVALAIDGGSYTSEVFAQKLNKLQIQYKRIIFIIGSSHGLHATILKQAHHLISFSKMTFPHQLARVLLVEQVYRAFKISNGEKYHK